MNIPFEPHGVNNSSDPLAAALGPSAAVYSDAFSRSVMKEIRGEVDRRNGLRYPWALVVGASVIGIGGALFVPLSSLVSVMLACVWLPLALVAIVGTSVAEGAAPGA